MLRRYSAGGVWTIAYDQIVSDSSDVPEPSDLALDEGMLLYVSVVGPTQWHKRRVLADDLPASGEAYRAYRAYRAQHAEPGL